MMKMYKGAGVVAGLAIVAFVVLGTATVPVEVAQFTSLATHQTVAAAPRCPTPQESVLMLLKRRLRIP